MYSAANREITGPALSSRAEDTEFWVLVCEDEEWLQAEFEAIVSEPTETPTQVIPAPTAVGAAFPPRGRCSVRRDPMRACRLGDRPERHVLRERSPPTRSPRHNNGRVPLQLKDYSLISARMVMPINSTQEDAYCS